MSTQLAHGLATRLVTAIVCTLLMCAATATVAAQQLTIKLTVAPETSKVMVEGTAPAATAWSFRNEYAGVLGLGARIEKFTLLDENGSEIAVRRIAPGQFQSSKPGTRFRYEVNVSPPVRFLDAAKVSWLTKERGLLKPADLLPLLSGKVGTAAASIHFDLPASWSLYLNGMPATPGPVSVADVDRAVFALGTHLRNFSADESGMTFGYVSDGAWSFQDGEALEMAVRILKAHREVFGAMPAKKGAVILLPFPQIVGAREWSAETRGSTVTLLIGNNPSKVGALAQLSTPLTHELFHLWIPNGVNLNGDYDWFYEGFTVYQAMRTAVRLDLLTFPEFLNAIARAFDAYLNGANRDRLSLIDASKQRWTIGESYVYSKSLVIAFVYDLRLRHASRGKQSLDNAYRKLYREYGGMNEAAKSSDGNDAAMKALALDSNTEEFVRGFVKNPISLDLATELDGLGLSVDMMGLRHRIAVKEKLTREQRDLLSKMGYNAATHAPRSR